MVVELTRREWAEFRKLAYAVEGKEERESNWMFMDEGERAHMVDTIIQFEGVFGAIRAFRQANFRFNELSALVEQFGLNIGKGLEEHE